LSGDITGASSAAEARRYADRRPRFSLREFSEVAQALACVFSDLTKRSQIIEEFADCLFVDVTKSITRPSSGHRFGNHRGPVWPTMIGGSLKTGTVKRSNVQNVLGPAK